MKRARFFGGAGPAGLLAVVLLTLSPARGQLMGLRVEISPGAGAWRTAKLHATMLDSGGRLLLHHSGANTKLRLSPGTGRAPEPVGATGIYPNTTTISLEKSARLDSWENLAITPEMLAADGSLILPKSKDREFYRLRYEVILSDYVLIPAGSFQMGDAQGVAKDADEVPVHNVFISDFFMARNMVTKKKWRQVEEWALQHGYPGFSSLSEGDEDFPAWGIYWSDALGWCNALSEMEGLTPCYSRNGNVKLGKYPSPWADCNWTADGYRLATEAEWEKAARGGLVGLNFPNGNSLSHGLANYAADPSNYAYDANPGPGYHPLYLHNPGLVAPVGQFAPNAYGLFDMTGNVGQYCWDGYVADFYANSPAADPRPSSNVAGDSHVLRGGSAIDGPEYNRCANRARVPYRSNNYYAGVRLVRNAPP